MSSLLVRLNFLPFLILFFFFYLSGSAENKEFTECRNRFPEENAVYVKKKESANIFFDKEGNLSVYSDNYEEMILLTEKVSQYAEKAIPFSSFSEIQNLKASTLVPKGNNYKKVEVRNITTRNNTSDGIFYDDNKIMNLVYPLVQPGARIVLSYRELLKEPHFFGAFYFSSFAPTLESEYTVTLPKTVKIRFKLFNISEKDLETSKTETKTSVTYTWKAKNVSKFHIETNSPNIKYFEPHLIIYIEEYVNDGKTQKLLSGPSDLYKWYMKMMQEVNAKESADIKLLVDSITKGVAADEEKVKRIFYWVQDHIQYVAFEDGLGGFVPRQASAICSQRYGDCKDMASLMQYMLKLSGVKAHVAWIGTRDLPYSYSEVPTPFSDNHMIAAYKKDGKVYFLDGTCKNLLFGLPSPMIQGKEALLSISDSVFEIIKVPEVPKEVNYTTDTTFIKIEGNRLKGKGSLRTSGFSKLRLDMTLDHLTETEKIRFFKQYLDKGNNKFHVDTCFYRNLKEREKELILNYEFNLPDYINENKEELYLNMHLNKNLQGRLIEDKRQTPYEFEYKTLEKHTDIAEIPKGYTVSYLPRNSSFSNKLFGYEIKYRQEGNKVFADKTIYIDCLLLNNDAFSEWNQMVKSLSKAYNESIIFSKK